MMRATCALIVALLSASVPTVAVAAEPDDEAAELWLNPSSSFQVDSDTSVELETAQRFRSADDGRSDTYLYRLWINQDLSEDVTLSGAVERRINTDGDADETRFIQQVSASRGIWRTRFRLEQRFVDDSDRMGLRLRPRLGVSVPLGSDGRWSFKSDAELVLVLMSTSRGGDTGLTGLRTQIGFSYDVSDRLTVSAGYLRQEAYNDDRPDKVGHAPLIGVELKF